MNLKVLKNDLQSHLEGGLFHFRHQNADMDSDDLLNDIVGRQAPRIAPVFNRVGFYLLDNKTAWYEFKLPSGRFVGVKYGKEWFDFQMQIHNADEKPVCDEEWKMIQHLIKKGLLPNRGRWSDESYRRDRRRQKVDMDRHMLGFRRRMKIRLEEKRKEKENG